MSKKTATLAHVRQLARLGIPAGLFVASLLPILRELCECRSAAFFWLDDTATIANFYGDGCALPNGGTMAALQPLAALAAEVVASGVDEAAGGNEWYGDLLRENGARHVLQAEVRNAGREIGRLAFFRAGDSRPFGREERATLASLLHCVAQGLAVGEPDVPDVPCADGGACDEELIVADSTGLVHYASEEAQGLLLMATGCAIGPRTLAEANRESRKLLCALCAAPECGASPSAAGISRQTNWGTFVLRAHRLTTGASEIALVGVHIRRERPAALRFVNAMDALPLSPQQRQIALLLASGSTKRDIARQLSVSFNTVAYHVKRLFEKLGVHDRAELFSRLGVERPAKEGRGRRRPETRA